MRGARVVAIRFTEVDSIIPASVLSHHPSLWRLEFDSSGIPPLRALARYTQLHGLRELVCWQGSKRSPSHELQHVQPLSQLEVLDIRVRQTAGAEGALASLPRLRELNLSGSDLRTVPASMASLTRLTHLSLTKTRVSRGWQHLPLQLKHLELDEAQLPTVPPELYRLSCLTELDLSYNQQLEGGLEALSSLGTLQKLRLYECRLLGDAGLAVALPPALQYLDISVTILTAVPVAFAVLANLTELRLCGSRLSGGWHHLAAMQQLADLVLCDCGLTAVPQVLSQLTALTSLNLGGNPMASGWQHLAGMQQLSDLSVWKCNLTAVPPVFSQLTALTYLSLHGNAIASGWQHLSLLPLHKLWTDDPAHCFI